MSDIRLAVSLACITILAANSTVRALDPPANASLTPASTAISPALANSHQNDQSTPLDPASLANQTAADAAADKTSAAAADKKRSVLLGDISYSYAATEIGSAHGAHVKTVTVIKNVAIPKQSHHHHHHHHAHHHHAGKPDVGDVADNKHALNHGPVMTVRVPALPEAPSIHIGSRAPAKDRNTKTPVKAVVMAPAKPAKEVTVEMAAKPEEAAAKEPPASAAAPPSVDAGKVSEAAAAMEKEIARSLEHMHRMMHETYSGGGNNKPLLRNLEPLPEAMSLTRTASGAIDRPGDDRPPADCAADEEPASRQQADRPIAGSDEAHMVRGSFDQLPRDVEFVHLRAEPLIATRLPNQHQLQAHRSKAHPHKSNRSRHPSAQSSPAHHHQQHRPSEFVEDFSDYAMHHVQHLPSSSSSSSAASSSSPASAVQPSSHQTQQTAANALAVRHNNLLRTNYASAADDYEYRTIAESAADYAPSAGADSASSEAATGSASVSDNNSSDGDDDSHPEHDDQSPASAAYKLHYNKKIKPYTAPALHWPYSTTSTTTQRVPYQAPIKSQKPAQFYIIHEISTSTTQRPYLSPSLYNGYSLLLDGEQRAREDRRLSEERASEERLQLEQERQQLELRDQPVQPPKQQQHHQFEQSPQQQQQQQKDRAAEQQNSEEERLQQRLLNDHQARTRFLQQHFAGADADDEEDDDSDSDLDAAPLPRAEFLYRGPTPSPTTTTMTLRPVASHDQLEDFAVEQHNVIQHPAPSSAASGGKLLADDVEVFASVSSSRPSSEHDTSAADSPSSQSYRQLQPTHAGRRAPKKSASRQPSATKSVGPHRSRKPTSASSSSSSSSSSLTQRFSNHQQQQQQLQPSLAGAFVAVPLDISTQPPFQRDREIGPRQQQKMAAHLVRHQFVFDSQPPHAFLESPFRPQRKQRGAARTRKDTEEAEASPN